MEGKYLYRNVCSILITFLCTFSFYVVWYDFVEDNNQTGHLLGRGNLIMAFAIYMGLLIFLFHNLGGFAIGVDRISKIMASQVISLFLLDLLETFISCAITGNFRFWHLFAIRYLLLFLGQSFVICFLTYFLVAIYRRKFPPLQVLEIYGEHKKHSYCKMDDRPDKYHVSGHVSYLEGNEKIIQRMQNYDAVLINDVPDEIQGSILKICFDLNKRVYFTPRISDIMIKSSDNLNLFDTPLYLLRNKGMSFGQRFFKRLLDLVLSAIALVILSPLFLVVAICIKVEDGGPVFYKQERCTIGMKKFWIYKFRSMIVDAEKDGKSHPAGEKDDRITKVGRVIRATRIDELPQLINIIKGDMSIIGPRPERVEHVQKYIDEIPEFKYRYKVKGGLSGYAQVYGKYNTSALDKLKLDLIYITNYSLVLDVQIVFETFKIIFQKESTEGFSEEQQEAIMDDDPDDEKVPGFSDHDLSRKD